MPECMSDLDNNFIMEDNRTSNDVFLEFGPETPHAVSTRSIMHGIVFADIEIRHGDAVFSCHRAFLCAHSKWFEYRLMNSNSTSDGEFADHIRIPEEISREEVKLIVEYIYASRFNLRAFLGDQPLLQSIIRVWRLAHYFHIESLKSLALSAFKDSINHWYKKYADCIRNRTLESFPTAMVAHLIGAIGMLYDNHQIDAKPVFRSPLLATALCGIKILCNSAQMAYLLNSSPAFTANWARVLMQRWTHTAHPSDNLESAGYHSGNNAGSSSPSIIGASAVCAQCHQRFDQIDSEPCPNLLKWAKKQVYEELCSSCLPETTLEEWMKA